MWGDDGAEPVYDILDCGDRNRFCTPFAVAHNCLGLGYGCGPDKFVTVAKILAGLDLSLEEATKTVREYRESNPKIVSMWAALQSSIRTASRDTKGDKDFRMTLPSGNQLDYRDVKSEYKDRVFTDEDGKVRKKRAEEFTALVCRTGRMTRTRIFGPLAYENLVQSVARDVFATGLLRLEAAGYPIILSVHDEAVLEVPEDADLTEITKLMTVAPEWMPALPLAAEAVSGPNYAI